MTSYLLVKERNKQHWVTPSRPQVIGYFAEPRYRSEEITFCDEQNALGSLKYYDKDVDLNEVNTFVMSKKMVDNLSRGDTNTIQPLEEWISKHKEMAVVKKAKFFTNRLALTRVVNTLNDSRSLNLYVKFRDEKYYISSYIPTHYLDVKNLDALNFSLFNKLPDAHTLATMDKDEHFFNAVYETKLCGKSIIYSAEIPGVICDQVINTLEELKAATFVDTVMCRKSGGGECRYCAHYWTGASLISADRVLIAHQKKDKNVKVQETTVDQLIAIQNRYKDLNMPYSAWNLLDDLLTFIERTVGNDPQAPASEYQFILEDRMVSYKITG